MHVEIVTIKYRPVGIKRNSMTSRVIFYDRHHPKVRGFDFELGEILEFRARNQLFTGLRLLKMDIEIHQKKLRSKKLKIWINLTITWTKNS